MMLLAFHYWLFIASLPLARIDAFAGIQNGRSSVTTALFSTTDTSTVAVQKVVTDEDVLNIAAFRNKLKNPEIMVEEAKRKRSETDNTASALKGLSTGFLTIGIPVFAYDYWQSEGDLLDAFERYLAIGGTIGVILGVNNYMGKAVYVPDVPEATNRILVDFAEGLKKNQDVGYCALSDDPRFAPAGGVMGCVDGQLRNSDSSPTGIQVIPSFPPHLHIKNMLVHETMRRQGVGQALLEAFEKYAREETDAEMITLEVEEENIGAVRLYEKAGYEFAKNPTTFTKRKFMTKSL